MNFYIRSLFNIIIISPRLYSYIFKLEKIYNYNSTSKAEYTY